ncbi:MAG: alpha/beta fold hydrolase [Acidobacteria bacterium]|nr:alpha/beta fold hydrolase [Acidobacteriota bacterium]
MTHETPEVFSGPDGPIGFSVHGEGPPLFLVGGLGSTARIWGDFPGLLGRSFFVVCPDNRGVGSSRGGAPFTLAVQAKDLVSLMDHLGLEHAALLGASLGGSIVLETARRYPARVDHMVLVSCSARLGTHGRALMEALERLLDHVPPGLFGELLTLLSFAPPFHERHPALIRHVAALYGLDAADVEGTRRQLRHLLSGWDLGPHLATITAPALVLAGGRDPIIPVEATRELAEALPGARFRLVPDAAHSVLAEGGEEVLAEVITFLMDGEAEKPVAGDSV